MILVFCIRASSEFKQMRVERLRVSDRWLRFLRARWLLLRGRIESTTSGERSCRAGSEGFGFDDDLCSLRDCDLCSLLLTPGWSRM